MKEQLVLVKPTVPFLSYGMTAALEGGEARSTFAGKEMPGLLRSTNVTYRPIDLRMGPDDTLYFADWSNPIIHQGEVDFRDSRRDHEHSRIWRVTAKRRPLAKQQDLMKLDTTELLDRTLSRNGLEQEQARRVAALRLRAKRREKLAEETRDASSPFPVKPKVASDSQALAHPDPLPLGVGTAIARQDLSNPRPANSDSGNSHNRPAILLLPAGEGRGEGESLSVQPQSIRRRVPGELKRAGEGSGRMDWWMNG